MYMYIDFSPEMKYPMPVQKSLSPGFVSSYHCPVISNQNDTRKTAL